MGRDNDNLCDFDYNLGGHILGIGEKVCGMYMGLSVENMNTQRHEDGSKKADDKKKFGVRRISFENRGREKFNNMNCNKSGFGLIFERNMGNVEKCQSHISNMPMLTFGKPILLRSVRVRQPKRVKTIFAWALKE